ncbi:hypothetical protein TIFTF001_035617 [Ficus carica]|uniref:Uncharacterized protein n=1 Tax=Ficus carica TaxID=3494 RepID=A0AA88E547_FICCA|nr:hypothetical protein TIFTF001_035617 [Ficus carica]
MYAVDLAWEVGASQFGIRAVLCQPTSLRLTSLLQRPKDDVGWCLSLMVATRHDFKKLNLFPYRTMPPKRRTAPTQDVNLAAQGPADARVPPAPVNQPAPPKIPNADPVIPENPIAPEVPIAPVAVPSAPRV